MNRLTQNSKTTRTSTCTLDGVKQEAKESPYPSCFNLDQQKSSGPGGHFPISSPADTVSNSIPFPTKTPLKGILYHSPRGARQLILILPYKSERLVQSRQALTTHAQSYYLYSIFTENRISPRRSITSTSFQKPMEPKSDRALPPIFTQPCIIYHIIEMARSSGRERTSRK